MTLTAPFPSNPHTPNAPAAQIPHRLHVLHLVEPSAGDEAILACRAAMRIRSARHSLWIIGNAADEERARLLGLNTADRVGAPAGIAELAFRRGKGLATDRGALAMSTSPDIVHCWSVPALGLARLIWGRRAIPRAATLLRRPVPAKPGSIAFRRASWALEDTTLLAVHPAVRDAYAEAASTARGGTLLRDNIRLSPPPRGLARPHATRLAVERRAKLRLELGLSPQQPVVLLLADPPQRGDAEQFMFTLGLLFVAGVDIAGLLPAGVGQASEAARFMRHHGRRWTMRTSGRPLRDLLAAADLAVWKCADTEGCESNEDSAGPLSLSLALDAGVPVVADDSAISRTFLNAVAGHTIASAPTNQGLAQRLLELIRNPELHRNVAEHLNTAPTASGRTFESTITALWEERANVPIVRLGLPLPPSFAAGARP